jgi:glycosyltransferase involved in cell wall biosynthesis
MHHSNSSVAIILATYNGEKYLEEQLQSIASQTHTNWHLIVGDDGSTDGTFAILETFAKTHPVKLNKNMRLGFVENFLSTLFAAENAYDYYCFCDQDDIWDKDKIAQGIQALQTIEPQTPALYGSRTRLADMHGQCYGYSQRYKGPFTFRNSLVQCFAGGNTMMLNRAARELLHTAKKMPLISHDWWCYQLISGSGGHVIFDSEPRLSYRQHANAIAGSSVGFAAAITRIKGLLNGVWKEWNDMHVEALQANAALLTETNQRALNAYASARKTTLIGRLRGLYASGAYQQTSIGNAGLLAAALIKRL